MSDPKKDAYRIFNIGVANEAQALERQQDVIELLRAGLSDENLLAAVKDAKAVKFDLSVEGLKELLAGKVPNTVVAAMRSRMQIPLARP